MEKFKAGSDWVMDNSITKNLWPWNSFQIKVDHAESFQIETKLTEWWTITWVAIACGVHKTSMQISLKSFIILARPTT